MIYGLVFSQTPANDPHWQLKWQDEFNTFNSDIWSRGDTAAAGGTNQQPQLYLANQVWVSGGNLVIALNNTPITCPTPAPNTNWICEPCIPGKTYKYRSGWVSSNPAYNTRYGYIEARIKFPWRDGKKWGFWPAFWTTQWVNPHTNAAEIDICEIFARNNSPNRFVTARIIAYNPTDNIGTFHELSNFSYADWHTYAIEWDKNRLIWYLDGKPIYSLNDHKVVDPVRLILNLAILNGVNDGQYHPQTSPYFQEYMYVDYVKVYSLKCDKTTEITKITNFTNYNYAVKKSITLDNQTTIPANSNITLRATDFIALLPGFEVDTGRELYLDVTPCSSSGGFGEQPKPDELK